MTFEQWFNQVGRIATAAGDSASRLIPDAFREQYFDRGLTPEEAWAEFEVQEEQYYTESNRRFEAATHGTVPWSLDGWLEAIDWHIRLRNTPKDDWPSLQRNKPFHVVDENGDIGPECTFNPYDADNQLAEYFQTKYANPNHWVSHYMRYCQIREFLRKHKGQLLKLGLVQADGNISPDLLSALCELPFSRQRRTAKGDVTWDFDYREVLQRAGLR